jgi:hypothetical protein
MHKSVRHHEWANIHIRGTGRNNHEASFFKIDDTVLLDHAFYMGFYLGVLDRRDLSLVYSGFYNTSVIEDGPLVDPIYGFSLGTRILHGEFQTMDDFGNANKMAKKIKEYDWNHFIVVVSQYSWEK